MNYRIVDMGNIVSAVLAGGPGTRLWPLSAERAKPAVPFGAKHRLVDFQLSNLVNSDCVKNFVIVQYRAQSLLRHLNNAYASAVATLRGHFIRVLTPPLHEPSGLFESDADSLVQLRDYFAEEEPEVVLIAMADHIVKLDYRQIVLALYEVNADAIMVYRVVPIEQAAGSLGVLKVSEDERVLDMEEKPSKPLPIAGQPGFCRANLGIYAIRAETFFSMLEHIEKHCQPHGSLSRTGIPWLLKNGKKICAYDLEDNEVPGVAKNARGYWRDVGTLDTWFTAQMEVCLREPAFDMFSPSWPIYGVPLRNSPPTKLDTATVDGILCIGTIFQDRIHASHSVFGKCLIGADSRISHSVVFDSTRVGEKCVLDRVVLDKNIIVPPHTRLSADSPPKETLTTKDIDRIKESKGLFPKQTPVMSDGGILFFPKRYKF